MPATVARSRLTPNVDPKRRWGMPDRVVQEEDRPDATAAVATARRAVATRPPAAEEPPALERLEEAAAELARLAGARITAALGSQMAVEYKGHTRGSLQPTEPVTEVDRDVEAKLVAELHGLFPGHNIIGEEGVANVFTEGSPYTWLIDPVEGSQNFVHGVPLYGSCVAVLHEGQPVAGAIWTSTSHVLQPGVYHAHAGGHLYFDGEPVAEPHFATGRRRGLIDAAGSGDPTRYDGRTLGSAAVECALVASGGLHATIFAAARPWDVAAGVVLAEATGREVWIRQRARWQRFDTFPTSSERTLTGWKRTMLIGTPEAARLLR